MALLSAEMVAGLQAVALSGMPDLCTIERATQVTDDQGGWVDAWTNLATGVPCRVRRPAAGTEVQVAGRLTAVVPVAVMLPAGQDVGVRDRIVVTSLAGAPRFEVQVVLAPLSDEVARTALCDAVTA